MSIRGEATLVRVRVQPRASRDAVLGWRAGALRVSVTAPPVEGAANHAVAVVLAEALGLRPSAVRVVRGDRARDKVVRVDGVDGAALRAALRI